MTFTANAVAELCQLAYADNGETFADWSARIEPQVKAIVPKSHKVHFYHNSGTEAYLAIGHPFCILVHRGSSTVSDWIDNTLAIQTPDNALDFEGAKTHYGATTAGQRIWEQCADDVAGIPQDCFLLHAGHSRGGAIANDTAVRCLADGIPVYRLVTFGAHRYGNPTAARLIVNLLRDNIRRFVHTTDPVPLLPLPIRYRHAGRPVYLDSIGNAHNKPTWRYQVIDQVAVAIRNWWGGGLRVGHAHMLQQYKQALEKAEAAGSLL